MTVVRVDQRRVLALCAVEDGGRASVEIALVEPVAPGDRLLVHAGTAIAWLSAGEVGSASADPTGSSAGAELPAERDAVSAS
jgi:hydrogenase maturation factor